MEGRWNATADGMSPAAKGYKWDLFLISFVILFLELACIRWFPAHVLYLTFFTNIVLLACFLGMSVGCLIASKKRDYILWTVWFIFISLVLALLIEAKHGRLRAMLDVGSQVSTPDLVFFGTESLKRDINFFIPIEMLCAIFFVLIAVSFLGLGQLMGRAFNAIPNRVEAYMTNIGGSIVGILAFGLCSWLELRPFWWFLVGVLGIVYFLFRNPLLLGRKKKIALVIILVLIPFLSSIKSGSHYSRGKLARNIYWSPYYRIDRLKEPGIIIVNLIGHQRMYSTNDAFPGIYFYALPYLFQRDSGGRPFKDVLIIGAGSGNDVSWALKFGADRVDAVEIDPAILRIGKKEHPDQPYQDRRVGIFLDDGRNFLRVSDKKYDLIIYALVDSLVLHSGYSNIRLESFLFTKEAFSDIRNHLKEDGMFVAYNYYRQGWIVARLKKVMTEVFGSEPVIFPFPYKETIEPKSLEQGFTMIVAGNNEHIRKAFDEKGQYLLRTDQALSADTPNGFTLAADAGNLGPNMATVRAARAVDPGKLKIPTDQWPFLYLRAPMIPALSIRGILIMGVISFLMIIYFIKGTVGENSSVVFNSRMFFLGAGFMLIETKAVVNMALLFGSTWMVNSVVFLALLMMVFGANLFVLKTKPKRLWPYYLGLTITLLLNGLIPLDLFLGMDRSLQVLGSCLLVFAPILFAGVIFSKAFGDSKNPNTDFGFNIAGAMLGGLAEYGSMLLGFQYLMIVPILFYLLSMVLSKPIVIRKKAARGDET